MITRFFPVVATLITFLVLAIPSSATRSFYTLNRDNFTLELVNTEGSRWVIGPLGIESLAPDLAMHRNRLYLIESHYNDRSELFEIDQRSGTATFLGRVTAGGADVQAAEGLCSDGHSLWLSYDTGSGISNRRARLNLDGSLDLSSVVVTGTVDVDAIVYRGPDDWIGLDVHNPANGTTSLFTGAIPNTLWNSHPNSTAWTNDLEVVGSELWGISGNPARPGEGGALVRYDGSTGALLETILFAESGRSYSALASASPSAAATAGMALVNPGFEAWDVTSGGIPTAIGHWNGDKSLIHSAPDQGISARSGSGMLQFIGTTDNGGGSGITSSEILQLVDLGPLQESLDAGREVELEFSCFFNRVAGDAGTDTHFHLTIYLFEGPIGEFSSRWPSGYEHRVVESVFTDSDPETWEQGSCRLVMPAGFEYVAVRITASENVEDDGGAPAVEFDGHYADDAMLTVRVKPEEVPMTVTCHLVDPPVVAWGSTEPQQPYVLQATDDLSNWNDLKSVDGGGSAGSLTVERKDREFFRMAPLGELPVGRVMISDGGTETGDAWSFTLGDNSFSDPDGSPLRYSASLADGTPLPDWLSFDPVTRTISGTPGTEDVGTLHLRISADDQIDGQAHIEFQLTINSPLTRIIGCGGDLDFGELETGSSATREMTISNTGTSELTVTGISYPEGFSGDWSSGTIAVGGSQSVMVSFSPVAEQAYGGTVTVSSDATDGDGTIAASGTGVGAAPAGTLISFELPEFATGSPPPGPWVTSSDGGILAVLAGQASDGVQSLALANNGGSYASAQRTLTDLVVPGSVTFELDILPGNFAPGAYEAGYIPQAAIVFYTGAIDSPSAISVTKFEMAKPFEVEAAEEHRDVYIYNGNEGKTSGTHVGQFLPGVYHRMTITFDASAGTVTVSIRRPDEEVLERTTSWDPADTVTKIGLFGMYLHPAGVMPVYFDRLLIQQ